MADGRMPMQQDCLCDMQNSNILKIFYYIHGFQAAHFIFKNYVSFFCHTFEMSVMCLLTLNSTSSFGILSESVTAIVQIMLPYYFHTITSQMIFCIVLYFMWFYNTFTGALLKLDI